MIPFLVRIQESGVRMLTISRIEFLSKLTSFLSCSILVITARIYYLVVIFPQALYLGEISYPVIW
ncbi:hypothetical protein [Trichormus sp. NMC-1]|uniref:hypothetical protein n=1 Tax=Trichormus sp. NMC-1 TaxID=1853259 RepID=UPI0008DC27DA|nr:hypothetical protein [Trichormus sp. NMC-1]